LFGGVRSNQPRPRVYPDIAAFIASPITGTSGGERLMA